MPPPQKKKSNKLGNILLWKESSIVPDSFSFNRDTFPKNSAPATLMQAARSGRFERYAFRAYKSGFAGAFGFIRALVTPTATIPNA